jgi:hypothetical protein
MKWCELDLPKAPEAKTTGRNVDTQKRAAHPYRRRMILRQDK